MIIDIHLYTEKYTQKKELPTEAILKAIEEGLDAVVLVERNRLWSSEEIAELKSKVDVGNFLILSGQLVKCEEGNVLIIGADSLFEDGLSAFNLKHRVVSEGGCCIFVPDCSDEKSVESAFEFINKKLSAFDIFDGIEIYHSEMSKKDMRDFLELRRKVRFCALAGSCSTTPALYCTKFFANIQNEKELASEIINGKVYPCPINGFSVDPRGGSLSKIEWNTTKSEMIKLKGLVFDLYGTLVSLTSTETYTEFHRLAMWLSNENIQVSGISLMNYYREKCSEFYANALKTVKFPEVDILQVLKDAITFFSGKPCSNEFARKAALVFRTFSIKKIKLYPHTRRVLRELKRRGYRMGIISNAQAGFTIPEIEDLKLWQFFDFIILSSDVGCSKPEDKIYGIASRQLELPPSKTAFIGDDLYGDIFGAKKHGYKTVFVKTNVGNLHSPGEVTPDVTLVDGDLRNLLRIFP